MKNSYCLIGIDPDKKEVVFLASCLGGNIQSHWDEMPDNLIPAFVPVEQAGASVFEPIKPEALTRHVFNTPASGEGEGNEH